MLDKERVQICKFMENPSIFNDIDDATLYQIREQGNMTYHMTELKYHNSWDWLMPVVRRIVEISCNGNDDAFMSDEYTSILDIVPLAIIEDTYRVVLEFIEYYSELT